MGGRTYVHVVAEGNADERVRQRDGVHHVGALAGSRAAPNGVLVRRRVGAARRLRRRRLLQRWQRGPANSQAHGASVNRVSAGIWASAGEGRAFKRDEGQG